MPHQLGTKLSDLGSSKICFKDKITPPADIQSNVCKSFIHWNSGFCKTSNPCHVSKRVCKSFSENYPDVFYQVMLVYVKVALGSNLKVKLCVPRKRSKHMIKKPDPSADICNSFTIKVQFKLNVGFFCLAGYFTCSHEHHILFKFIKHFVSSAYYF